MKTFGTLPGGDVHWDVDPTYTLYVVADSVGNCVVRRLADGAEVMRLMNTGRAAECWPKFGPGTAPWRWSSWTIGFSSGGSRAPRRP